MKNCKIGILLFLMVLPNFLSAQEKITTDNWLSSPGIIGTFILIAIVMIIAIIILFIKLNGYIDSLKRRQVDKNRIEYDDELFGMDEGNIDSILEKRKAALKYKLKGDELSGDNAAIDEKGLLQRVVRDPSNAFFDEKKKTTHSLETPQELK